MYLSHMGKGVSHLNWFFIAFKRCAVCLANSTSADCPHVDMNHGIAQRAGFPKLARRGARGSPARECCKQRVDLKTKSRQEHQINFRLVAAKLN